jgi:hypothetical protein
MRILVFVLIIFLPFDDVDGGCYDYHSVPTSGLACAFPFIGWSRLPGSEIMRILRVASSTVELLAH